MNKILSNNALTARSETFLRVKLSYQCVLNRRPCSR